MIYPIVQDIADLRQKPEKFNFDKPQVDPSQLAIDMAESMIVANGMGLSANQIGFPYQAFVMTGSPIIACFNPIVVDTSDETIVFEEGCLSLPGIEAKISRPRRIKVRYTQPDGEVITRKLDDLSARIFLHEMDHCSGMLMYDHLSKLKKDMIKKKLNVTGPN